ncbi:restriction endonuclease subunit S [uncultured Bifidobacterium sp.]|uniref:restriction endonuclease subunit S n=1 Tax=uncultured Bifidobacterium sp. TaxID=165187 RepID=UPI00265FF037|nr:restriction endonuclease subunit S [uncultured Bifidobacterium sp.]
MAEQHGKTLVPQIRFAGFTDPWEQRKLGELFEESDERASDREILSVSVANGIYPASESDRETNPGASLANYKIVHFGDVVYNSMRMWQGAVDASRYDGIVSPAYVVARPNSEVYARFFARLLRQPMLLKQYQQVSQGNSKDTQVLKFDDFASIGISMPASENEQRRIGGFFDRLDSLITLHQRKYDKLCVLKKSMLDKMFPKGGSLYPEIRFAGFTDPWEQRKLGEFGSVAMCKRIYKEQTSEQGDVPFFKIGTFGANPDAFISNELFEDFKCIYPYPTPGTLLISAAGSIGRVVEYQGEKAYFQDSNIVWLEHDHRLNDAFLKPLYSRIEWGLEGSTIKRLYNKDLLSAEVTVPGGREQKEIGQFFAKLDNLITLHQRKLELLRNIKKSMLDKMFV